MRNLNAQKARKFKETIIQLPANKREISEYKNKNINEILSMNNIESMSVQTANSPARGSEPTRVALHAPSALQAQRRPAGSENTYRDRRPGRRLRVV